MLLYLERKGVFGIVTKVVAGGGSINGIVNDTLAGENIDKQESSKAVL